LAKFGVQSWTRLQTCHPSIILVFKQVIEIFDVTVLCGFRDEVSQNLAYPKYTRVKWPDSKHNKIPSLAVDVIPYDSVRKRVVAWDDVESFALMAGYILCTAKQLGVELRWGHDWNNNTILSDEVGKLADRPHFELI